MSVGYGGRITGLHGDVLQGWAMHAGMPDLRVGLEVYLDGAFVALARADMFEHAAKQGDGFHGFAVQLRASWLERATTISVRVANQGPWLDGTLTLPTTSKPAQAAPISSQVWYGGGLKFNGWAWDPHKPERHVEVTVREGDQVLTRVAADKRHPALVYRPTADHGFEIDLPWALADGRPHVLHIETDLGQPVGGSPVTVVTLPKGLEGLLRQHWPGGKDDASLALLARMAAEQDRLAPRTAGFACYPEWFAVFQQPDLNMPPPAKPLPLAGILVYGKASKAEVEASLASIANQMHATALVARAQSSNLVFAAQSLLQQGAQAIVPLHAGDRLAPHAMLNLLPVITGKGASAWAYGDCDCDGPEGERTHPWLKPSWDIDLFLGADIVTPGAAYGAAAVRDALALLETEGAPKPGIHGLTAAIAATTRRSKARVTRITRVLYHRRYGAPVSPAHSPASRERETAMRWLAQSMAPGAKVDANPHFPSLLRVHWPLPKRAPKVSLIVPTRDQLPLLRECVDGVLNRTDYHNIELIVVDNDSCSPDTLNYLDMLRKTGIKVLRYPHPFNYSAINNFAVEHATGTMIALLNNDVAILNPIWLKSMVAQLLQPGVGIVGAKLLWPNGMVQHGGVVIGINGLAAHTGNRWHSTDDGYLGFNQLTRRQSAVTAACLLVRKSLYQKLGGLDSEAFPIAFNDVDLCLRSIGRRESVVWTPLAELVHRESASRGKDLLGEQAARAYREQLHLMTKWMPMTQSDDWYHPDLASDWAIGPYGGLQLHKCP